MLLQWGHRLSAMERAEQVVEDAREVVLQWGHRLSAMERTVTNSKIVSMDAQLQWGHRLSAMERTQ